MAVRSPWTLGAVVAGLAAGAAWLPDAPAQDRAGVARAADEFPWRRDLVAARAEARTSGQPLFVRFR